MFNGVHKMRFTLRCAALICGLALVGHGYAAEPVDTHAPLTIQSQGSFFIGGTVRHAAALSGVETGPDVTREGDITTGQMYVQYQVPVAAGHLPVVMIHGGGLSGQADDTTPDGRMGWNEYFLRSGRPVYVVDQAGRARSGFDATPYNEARLGTKSPKDLAPILIIGHEYAWTWFRIGPKFGVPFPDTQFPVEAVGAFYKMWIPDLNASLPSQNPSYADLAALAQKVGGAILMGHLVLYAMQGHTGRSVVGAMHTVTCAPAPVALRGARSVSVLKTC